MTTGLLIALLAKLRLHLTSIGLPDDAWAGRDDLTSFNTLCREHTIDQAVLRRCLLPVCSCNLSHPGGLGSYRIPLGSAVDPQSRTLAYQISL